MPCVVVLFVDTHSVRIVWWVQMIYGVYWYDVSNYTQMSLSCQNVLFKFKLLLFGCHLIKHFSKLSRYHITRYINIYFILIINIPSTKLISNYLRAFCECYIVYRITKSQHFPSNSTNIPTTERYKTILRLCAISGMFMLTELIK